MDLGDNKINACFPWSPPLEHPDSSVDGEWLGRIFQPNHTSRLEELLVNVGMGLQLDRLVGCVLQFQPD